MCDEMNGGYTPTEMDIVNYELATIAYDYKVHPEAMARIMSIMERYVTKD